jgi:uroporphyrinogen-III synthase
MTTVFISKDPEELNPVLHQLWSDGLIAAQSLLVYNAQDFKCLTDFDIVFFASIRAAQFYLAKCTAPKLIACAGAETAQKLKVQFGLNADFIAQQSGDPDQEALAFNSWRGERKVLFPSSNLSLGTYTKPIPESEKSVVNVYRTDYKTLEIKAHQVYIFSSPSNVMAFFQCNQIPENAQVIAWGKSTEKALLSKGIKVGHILLKSQQEELATWLKTANYY